MTHNKHYPETDEDEFSIESIFRTDESRSVPDPQETEAEKEVEVDNVFFR